MSTGYIFKCTTQKLNAHAHAIQSIGALKSASLSKTTRYRGRYNIITANKETIQNWKPTTLQTCFAFAIDHHLHMLSVVYDL